ncbi:MAG: protein translocase subunit SecF [Candidatus Kerfeldbacteria bacterium]|nr:protein translocase subunit SecF [Candidatus Kerfeldbacteria bacterium]
MFQIIRHRRIFLAFSALLVVLGVAAFAVWGLKLGIDFTGGTIVQYEGVDETARGVLRSTYADAGLSPVLQRVGADGVSIRLSELSLDDQASLRDAVSAALPNITETSFETIGPTIGRELRQKAVVATALVLVGIVLYVTWAFRRVSIGPVRAWVYGAATIIALAHDLVVVIGVFAILGTFFNVEIDSLFVTALLTVLGFSVHDTIVVFDRIRERLGLTETQQFAETVNESVNQTMVRSLATSATTLLVLVALFLFGGESIRYFTLALVVGIVSGTYSSIFVASPLLVVWERWRNT